MARRNRGTPYRSPPSEPVAEPAQQPGYRPSSRRRAILFRVLAALSPLYLLGLINLELYWCGIGYDTRVVVPVETSGAADMFCLNEQASRAYYSGVELAGPNPRPFQLPAPRDTYRIVVVGESSVQGYPYYPELAFPRQLEIFLQRQLPGRRIEVLNAGIVGINSFALVDFVPRMLACQPDLVVVYTGHNEFYGPGGVASTATRAPFLYPAQTQLRRWRLYQWLQRTIRADSPRQPLITALPRDLDIQLDGPAFQRAERYFRAHLRAIARGVERHDVPLLFCSLACNLSDQSPVRSLSKQGLTDPQRAARDAALRGGEQKLAEQDYAAALTLLDQAAAIDAGYALIAYRRAACLAATGQRAEALEQYRRARDLDGCRFRAPSSFREIVRQVATDARPARCFFLDLDEELARRSQQGVPGHDLFCEHVHFTFDGHREVARAIARSIVEQVEGQTWQEDLVPTDDQVARASGLTTFDHLMALGYALRLVHEEPFHSAPDAQRQSTFLSEAIKRHLRTLPALDQITFAELGDELRRRDLVNGMASGLLERGETQRALDLFHTAQRRRPWEITSYVGIAKCRAALGQLDEASAALARALELAPEDLELQKIRAVLSAQKAAAADPLCVPSEE